MKAVIFVVSSAVYAFVAFLIYTGVLLQCGLGPDSPSQCDAIADRQAFIFAVGAIAFYAILSIGYWRLHRKSKG
jgi:hypothetical protein